MNPKLLTSGLVACILLFVSLSLPGQVQNGEQAQVRSKYAHAVDRAFQFTRDIPAEFTQFDTRIVVRYLPSFFQQEWQVEFHILKGHAVRAVVYRLKNGTRPIFEECDRALAAKPDASVDDILKLVSVEKAQIPVGSSVTRLIEQLFRVSVPANLNADLTMDGTTYHLWVQTPSNRFHAEFSDGAYGDATNSTPIIQWIRSVRAELEKQR